MTDPYLQFMNLLDTYDAGLDEMPGPTGEVLSDDELRLLFQQLNPKYTERLHDPSYYEHVTNLINMKKQEEESKKVKRNQAKGQGKQGKKYWCQEYWCQVLALWFCDSTWCLQECVVITLLREQMRRPLQSEWLERRVVPSALARLRALLASYP